MQSYNRPQIPASIVKALGITTGAYSPLVSDDISPVIVAMDLGNSPYVSTGVPVRRDHTAGAVAAKSGVVVARPGGGTILQITRIEIPNESGAVLVAVLTLMPAASIAALTTALGTVRAMQNTASGFVDATVAAATSSSLSVGANATILGVGQGRYSIPINETLILDIPAPGILLFDNDPNGAPGLGIWHNTVNVAITATFHGRQWPQIGT